MWLLIVHGSFFHSDQALRDGAAEQGSITLLLLLPEEQQAAVSNSQHLVSSLEAPSLRRSPKVYPSPDGAHYLSRRPRSSARHH
eukprot:scaffold2161_cov244-Pinguiococcus_pyrenoidosus.AAC.21